MAVADRPLLDRLVAEAEHAIRDLAPELRRRPEQLRSVNLELSLGGNTQITDATAFVERRLTPHGDRPERLR